MKGFSALTVSDVKVPAYAMVSFTPFTPFLKEETIQLSVVTYFPFSLYFNTVFSKDAILSNMTQTENVYLNEVVQGIDLTINDKPVEI